MDTQRQIILACQHEAATSVWINYPTKPPNYVACCVDCWNKSVAARRAERAAWRESEAERGRQYWQGRGIRPGDKLIFSSPSMLPGIFGMVGHGTAKVGIGGAWVSSKTRKGKLAPEGWRKV